MSRLSDLSASSRRPTLTKCHGDSGAKHKIGIKNAGHTHWIAIKRLEWTNDLSDLVKDMNLPKGILNAH